MDDVVTDQLARQCIAILRGGNFVKKVVLMDENDVIIAIHELPRPIAFSDTDYAEVSVKVIPPPQGGVMKRA